ncbi:HPr kinase/phosphatase C-terminal domain-containing protein [Coxiella endosymbiont of Dermacentor marginatus]|uniref:HPr kinase/phosphatase C-terminal domain-containing protein n=1 Tax=Coxiella endosymbiont of Dermacentor marginatus TaxID=1656159 RepID=UPI0022231493|nr:HPr kinase/phosphatase C-terminal domain-containing protein [Coxiella endosymbiont of Dermacentor marginatus]
MLPLSKTENNFWTFQPNITLHANFLIIEKLGVLIMGEPSIGKSELTLALLDRGYQMVCDDVVDITCKNNQLIGRCPDVAYGYILISDIGMVNVPKLFGFDAVVAQYEISLIIKLIKCEKKLVTIDPLNPTFQEDMILGIIIPKIIFPVYVGRNLPLLVETLIRNQMLKKEAFQKTRKIK